MSLGWEGWFTLAIVALMVVGLAQERLSPDTIVLGALVALLLAGVLEFEEAVQGFASPAVITVGALFVIAASMRHTGALADLSDALFGRVRTPRRALLRLTGVTTVASAFLNNTPVVAMFMPAVIAWAKRLEIAPSRLLIPLSYAAIVGGVCTLIGTSTNLVVSGLLQSHQQPPFGMFELAWVGVPCALVAMVFLAVFGSRLLPDRTDALRSAGETERRYLVDMRLESGSPLCGRTIEQAGLRHLPGLFLVRIERASGVISPVGPDERLCDDDLLTFVGVVDTIRDLRTFRGLVPAAHEAASERDPGWRLHETVVSGGSPLVGQSIREAGFRGRYNAAVVAVHRHGERIDSKIGDIVLRPGDVLLIEAGAAFARSFRDSTDFYLVSEVEQSETLRHRQRPYAAAILAGVVGLGASGLMPVSVAALGGAMGTIALRCLTPGQARRSIDASVLIVIAAALGIARALEKTGIAGGVAEVIVSLSEGLGPLGVIALVYVITMVLTELITNNAAAALVFPVALASAAQVGGDPRRFAIVVAVAASLSLTTPLGYQTNLMVYGPGGYRFTDFVRIGLPLQLVLGAVAITAVVLFFD